MGDQALVRCLDVAADGRHHPDAVADAETMPVAVGVDRLAVHELHDEIRPSRLVAPGVDEARDARGIESREQETLAFEARQIVWRGRVCVQPFDGDARRFTRTGPRRFVDRAEATAADDAYQRVRTEGPWQVALGHRGGRGTAGAAVCVGPFVGGDESQDLVAHLGVRLEDGETGLELRGGPLDGRVEEFHHAVPAIAGRHVRSGVNGVPDGSVPLSPSRCASQARAERARRFTVTREMPRSSAASSAVQPSTKRAVTT